MKHLYPILEHDTVRNAVLEPKPKPGAPDIPERGVACFFQDVIDGVVSCGEARHIYDLHSNMGKHPIYETSFDGKPIALFEPGLGAPFSGALIEEMIVHGCRKFIACGACGVLDGGIAMGHVVVPVSAVRDEGTSYHYLPPGREVEPTPLALAAVEATLKSRGCQYARGKTWTTDGIYRETRDKVRLRQGEGCLVVEMEAAALFAVARFRGVELAQLLCGGDDVSGEEWDHRGWHEDTSGRETVFRLAVEACAAM